MTGPIGRDAEREVAATFAAAAVAAPAVLEIEGEAGIGKTTLFRFAVESARQAGSRVLACALSEAESSLSFAGLTDLLSAVEPAEFDDLPSPQRHALFVATLRDAPADIPIDTRAVGTGLATLLAALAERTPLIVGVDDAQWLDQATCEVLASALRRLDGRPIGLISCRRTGSPTAGFTGSLDAPAWHRTLRVGGMSAAALFHVVLTRLGVSLARPLLLRIAEAAQGNPLLALELVRASTSGAPSESDSALALTESLQLMMVNRMSTVSEHGRDALLAVACAGRPTLAVLDSLGLRSGVEEAESADLVSIEDGRVVFDHPLLSAAVVQAATGPAIHAIHGRLGAVTSDLEARARHLALANPSPDSATAAALDAAALSAEGRGATIAAAELARLALERTDAGDVDALWSRRICVARLLHTAGAAREAGDVLAGAEKSCPPGRLRAEAELILTEVVYQTSSSERAVAHAKAALAAAEVAGDASIRARALLSLAELTPNGQQKAAYAAQAQACLEKENIADRSLLAWAALEIVSARFQNGDGLDLAELNRALDLERAGRVWRSADQVAAVVPVLLKWADEYEDALRSLAKLRGRAEEEGNEGLLPYVTGHVPGILLRLGRFDQAAAAAEEHLAVAVATGQEGQRLQALYNVALVAAHLGNLGEATEAGREILRWSESNEDGWMEMSACAVLGFASLSAGALDDARMHLDRWWRRCEAEGVVDPGVSRFHGDHIEALIGLGSFADAVALTDILERRAERAGRVSASAVAARSRALLAAASGDQHAALQFADKAMTLHHLCPIDFERARTLLTTGIIHRRAKAKAAARRSFDEARSLFAALGAAAFVSRADAELERIGVRVSTAFELTATERRVAELTASGLTNRQVAEQAFMSPKTVEANLARVYRKLGIGSRAELGARMRGVDGG